MATFRTAVATIAQGQLLKKSSSAGAVTPLAVADDASLLYAVALTSAGEGQSVLVETDLGAPVAFYSDGTDAIAAGDRLERSGTTDGAVVAGTTTPIAIASGPADASLGALAPGVLTGGGGGGGSSGYPSPTTTADAVSGGAIAIDGSIENTTHLVALSASATLSISSPVDGETYVFIIDNAGAFDITWPAAFVWPSGVAPVMTPSGIDKVTATYDGAGYFADYAQDYG